MKHASLCTVGLLLCVLTGCSSPESPTDGGTPRVTTPDRVPAARLPAPVSSDDRLASCAVPGRVAAGGSHRIELTSASGEPIVFQVIEPKALDCTRGHPLVLHGHGFGGSRELEATGLLGRLQDQGYALLSIDQRGFGESGGTVRVMDPNFEGQDLLQILDWAEANIDYLAHERPRAGLPFNLVAGATGGSYGGMYQLLIHNMDGKARLDALTPDITPHDLRYSLNPNGVVKSVWALLLSVGGETGATQPLVQGLDPVIKETLLRGAAFNRIQAGALPFFYYHSVRYFLDARPVAEQDPINFVAGPLSGSTDYLVPAQRPRPASILFSQGMRDTLFNFNEGWANFLGYRALGGDVRLLSHQSGHILPGTATVRAQLTPLDPVLEPVLGGLLSAGVSLPELQGPGGAQACGSLDRGDAVVAFLNEKLSPPAAQPTPVAVANALARLRSEVCLSLSDGDAVWLSPQRVRPALAAVDIPATPVPVPNGALGLSSLVQPVFVPLQTLSAGQVLAGIGQLAVTLSIPGVPADACDLYASAPPELLDLLPQLGCDAIIHVGWGVRAGSAAPTLIDEQLTPLRGLGEHAVDLVGVGYRAEGGESLGLLLYGYNLQYLSSLSRDVLVPAVSVAGTVTVPLQP